MEKAAVICFVPPRFRIFVLLAAAIASGCAAKVEKGGYQVGLEAIAASAATGSFEELESALGTIDRELAGNRTDAQLWLLKANLLLRQIRLRADQPETWRRQARSIIEALQQAIESAQPPADPPDWIEPAAWVVAGDLVLIRAEAAVGDQAGLPSELTRISFADAAGQFHVRAHERVEALGRNASALARRQQRNAFQGWYASRLRVARSWLDLGLRPWSGPSLEELWKIQSEAQEIPKELALSGMAASLDPAHHRQSAQHAALAHRLTASQQTALTLAFESFRAETLAGFFEDPGGFEPPAPRFLNELGGELAASICEWRIDPDPPLSPAGFAVLISRPGEPWAGFAPPIRELVLRLGKGVEQVSLFFPAGGVPRVSEQGLRLEVGPGLGVSGCLDSGPRGTCRRGEAYLDPSGVWSSLSNAILIELEDGVGNTKARAVHSPVRFPSYRDIEDRMEDFQTHIRRRGFDATEARRMLWEVSELCPGGDAPNRHRCRLAVARGFAQLKSPERRLEEPVRQMLLDAHALAASFNHPARRVQALLREVAFDLDFDLADHAALPASTASKLDEVRRLLNELPAEQAAAFAYRLNALEAEYRADR